MSKIGLLTFHYSHNFGGNLQAYATQKVVSDLGVECEIIDYRIEKKEKNKIGVLGNYLNLVKTKKNRKYTLSRLLKKDDFRSRNNRFEDFRKKYLNISKEIYRYEEELQETQGKYDLFISGSDQIWNPTNYTYTDAFYFSFLKEGDKRISYASSLGVSYIPAVRSERIKELLERFNLLSCREEQGCKVISELVDRKVENVIDPTLLIDRSNWFKEETNRKLVDEEYIVCYCLSSERSFIDKIKQFNKDKNYKIISIFPMVETPKECYERYDIGPIEFVNLIKHSKGVITDSFHGMLFSINFNKPFLIGLKDGDSKLNDNSRKLDVLKLLELEDRVLTKDSKLDNKYFNIDYSCINIKLEELRKKSINYLKRGIELVGYE